MSAMLNIEHKMPLLEELFATLPDLQTVYLFGSYGTGYQTPGSDVDFAVLCGREITIKEEAAILNKLSILLDTDRVDLLTLNKAPLSLQFKIISEGRIVYERDYLTTCDYVERVISLYHDYAITLSNFYREYDRSLREAYADGR